MKVGIVTFNSAHNYGAVLQAWALQRFLSLEGHKPTVINYRLPAIDNVYRLYKPETPYKSKSKNKEHQAKQLAEVKRKHPDKVLAHQRFERFISGALNTTKAFTSFKDLKAAKLGMDALITGSDQVWNTGLTKGINPAYLLDFGPKEIRRISYAVSRGDKELTDWDRFYFERRLNEFDFISVREENVAEEISTLTDKEVVVTADPTFLVDREQFDTIRRTYKKLENNEQPYIYVHNVHLQRVDERLCSVAEELSKRTGLPVVTNRKKQWEYSNQLLNASDIGPREFLDVVANAEYVVTNSFHATAFSLIYHKKFITIPALRNPERMKKLLERLEVSNHLIEFPEEIPEDLTTLEIDYERLDALKAEYAEFSKKFLREALDEEYIKVYSEEKERSYMESMVAPSCYGCGACAEACENGCIHMEKDAEGFWYPVKDVEKCTKCGNCVAACEKHFGQVDDGSRTTMMAAEIYIDDPAKSGFRAHILEPFCKTMVQNGGVVVAKVSENQLNPEYRIMRTEEELLPFYAGCLTEADIRGAVKCCKDALAEEKQVLFVGSPCDIAAVRSAIPDQEKKLITLSTNCRGVVSEAAMKKYVEYLENKFESKLLELSFENRLRGFTRPYVFARFENREVSIEPAPQDFFQKAVYAGKLSRPSCYHCMYSGALSKGTDIVLISNRKASVKYREKQTEVLFGVNTEAGRKLIKAMQNAYRPEYDEDGKRIEKMSIKTLHSKERLAGKRATAYEFSKQRDEIMEQLETGDIYKLLTKK